ncbi:MAG: hypothetical protein AAF533_23405 [Acidobacteriota bacterium]
MNQRPPRPRRPLLLARLVLAGLVTWQAGALLLDLRGASHARWSAPEPPAEAFERLDKLRVGLLQGEATRMGEIFPEGEIFSWAFFGLAQIQLVERLPEDHPQRVRALTELPTVLREVEQLGERPPFDVNRRLNPPGGIIPAGLANLLRAGYLLLGGTDPDIRADHLRESRRLSNAFRSSHTGSLPTYHGLTWPVDSVAALESLRLHDELFGGTIGAQAAQRWRAHLEANLDPDTGLMPSMVDGITGSASAGPRGCALSWTLAFAPGFAPDLAAAQYERYRADWSDDFLGFAAFREWPPGQEGTMDADSGPVLAGWGAAASGLGLAASSALGDAERFDQLARGIELGSLPYRDLTGARHAFFDQFQLGETLTLWGLTARPWNREAPAVTHPARASWLPLLLVGSLLVLVVVSLLRSLPTAARRFAAAKREATARLGLSQGVQVAGLVGLLVLGLAAWWLLPVVLVGLGLEPRVLTTPVSSEA